MDFQEKNSYFSEMIKNPFLEKELKGINSHKKILQRINKLETSNLTIREQIEIINKARRDVKHDPILSKRIEDLMIKNPDLTSLIDMISQNTEDYKNIIAPLTTVCVARSFSALSYILNDRRTNLKIDTLEKTIFLY
ncbi:hypothetical protein DMUE_5804, partial [Dictyocoela muelleri]